MTIGFSKKIITWQRQAGRHDLPWQNPITPYRVWVSEIMLQQTQVATVISYFERFMKQFPRVTDLAQAPQDHVLHLWSGLGYYARARNLHASAKTIVAEHQGELPDNLVTLMDLPGIGRSTAGAILSLAYKKSEPILDGNVKRVLARVHGIDGWPGKTQVAQTLWSLAESLVPQQDIRAYTQGLMDLGATVCTRSNPNCQLCPVMPNCIGHQHPERYPGKKPKKEKPVRQSTFLMISDAKNRLYLEQRPSSGIWGGLWSFPELPNDQTPKDWCEHRFGQATEHTKQWSGLRHTFTHFHLDITPMAVTLAGTPSVVQDSDGQLWFDRDNPPSVGLAAPVSKLLAKLG